MKILVTGTGYLGSVICNLLVANEYEVIGLDNYMRPMSDFMFYLNRFPNFSFVKMDIRDEKIADIIKEVDLVVHTAGLSGEPICKSKPDEAFSVNLEGSGVIIGQVKKYNKKLIFHSSGSVYGKVDGVCTEQSPTHPLSIYAKDKLRVEQLITKHYPASIVFRFSTAYGLSGLMRTNLLLNDLTYQAVQGRDLTIFQPDFRRSFIHTSDVAYAIMAGIENYDKMQGEIYNVGSPLGNWTKRHAAEYVKSLTGCKVTYADDGYKDPDQRDYEISFDKIKPFWEAKVSMETGMSELVKGLKTLHEVSKFRDQL